MAELNSGENTKAICVFCCKICSNFSTKPPNNQSDHIKENFTLFFTFLERSFGNGETFTEVHKRFKRFSSDGEANICSHCNSFTKQICNLYNDLKCTELQIQHKLHLLLGIMKMANHVPSRLALAREAQPTKMDAVLEIRRELIRMCSQKSAKCYPRVLLEKLSVSPATLEDTTTAPTQENCSDSGALKSRTVSLATLLALKTPQSQYCRPNEENDIEENCFHKTIDSPPQSENENEPNPVEQKVFALQHDALKSPINKKTCSTSTITTENDPQELSGDNQSACSVNETAPSFAENLDCDLESSTEEIHEVEQKVFLEENQGTKNQVTNELCDNSEFTGHENGSAAINQISGSVNLADGNVSSAPANGSKVQSIKFWCKLCKNSSPDYAAYLIHCKLSSHTKRQYLKNTEEKMKNQKCIDSRPHQVPQPLSSNHETLPQSRYQFRQRQIKNLKTSTASNSDSSGESDNSSSKEFDNPEITEATSFDSNSSSSSSSSDSDQSESESKTKKGKHGGVVKMYSCRQPDCNHKTRLKSSYIMHQRFHKPENLPCFFCKFIGKSALDLALHEKQKHSKAKNKENAPSLHFCPRCPLKFWKKNQYVRHFGIEHLKFEKLDRHRCPICHILIRRGNMFQRHLKKFHDISGTDPSEIFYCNISGCGAYFKSVHVLRDHKNQVHFPDVKTRYYECVLCEQQFENITLLQAHKKLFHKKLNNPKELVYKTGTGKWVCTSVNCSYVVADAEELHGHLNLHGSFNCKFCDVSKKYAPNLVIHEMTHGQKFNIYKFKCQRCYFGTDSRTQYIDHHLETHLNLVEKSTCSICGESLKTVILGNHMTEFHPATETSIKCWQCSAYFSEQWQLLYHNQLQHMPTYKCEIEKCSEEFRFEIDLQKHQNLHETLNCKFCSKKFDFLTNLALHELEHVPDSNVNAQTLTCPRCPEIFEEIKTFVSHFLNTHLCLSPYIRRCNICEKSVEQTVSRPDDYIERHKRNCHSVSQLDPALIQRCDKCPAYFKLEEDLHNHKRRMHEKNSLECHVCKTEFENSETQKAHEDLHGVFSCQVCSVQKSYAKDLAFHELLQHGQIIEREEESVRIYKCPRCQNRPFSVYHLYVRHFLEEHLQLALKIHQCPVCNAKLVSKHELQKHMKLYHETYGTKQAEIHKCDKCSAYFSKSVHLKQHKNRVHGKGFICKICDQRFEKITLLQNHWPTHQQPDQWKFKCTAAGCSQKFPTKGILQTHIRTHAKTFLCDVLNCGQKFLTEGELQFHKKYVATMPHFEASGFGNTFADWKSETVKCEFCDKSLVRSGLGTHVKAIHMKERPTEYKCPVCDKTFQQKGALKNHQVYHQPPEEWKFMCAVCSKRCPSKTSLDQHMRTHTKEKPFVCQVCGEKYAHRHNLRNHVNSKHKDEGMQDVAKPHVKRFYVSRKGKKLGKEFCFMQEQDKQ